jgi:hypothetical protein
MIPRDRLEYSPIEGRAPLQLPDGVRLLVWHPLGVEEFTVKSPTCFSRNVRIERQSHL